jgi:serine phosphatase RsbU (regulator of sigma subunit)
MIGHWLRNLQDLFHARRGRPAALTVLVSLLVLNYSSELPRDAAARATFGGKLLTLATSPFASGRQLLFDTYQRAFPRQSQTQPVIVVEIDEESLREVGQWPWPRNRLAALVNAIADQGPAAIGLDMYMPEPDQTSPDRVAANLPAGQRQLAEILAALPTHEQQLAHALRAAPTVLGAAGFDFATYTTNTGLRVRPIEAVGDDPLPYVRRFPQVLASLPELQAAAHGQALLSVSMDDTVVRRMPLVMAVGEQLVPALAPEMLRVATGESSLTIDVDRHGIRNIRVADLIVPTQPGGDIWLHFARRAGNVSREVSAADVLGGRVEPGMLAGKLVLVGLTGYGLSDMRATPLGELVPGVEIQAQVLESFFDGRFLLRPVWMKPLELAVLASLGLIMVWLIPKRSSRVARTMTAVPNAANWVVMGLSAASLGIGYALFLVFGLMFDAASLFIGFSAVLASLVSSAMIEAERENERLAAAEQRLREENARVAGELAAARLIQMASLPKPAHVLAGETRFEIAVLLEPAREVGGDFYDFFMVGEGHLFFSFGDVSGKGVPASLLMAIAKALTKSAARRMGEGQIAAIVDTANREISAENPESMFVTLLAGIYEADGGRLLLCNAGHDAPLCRRANGQVEKLAAASGPPLCVLDEFPYAVEEYRLAVGDTLLAFTDGVTDACNAAGHIYSAARLRTALAELPLGAAAEPLVAAIRKNIGHYVGDAAAADDMALLAISRNA